MAKGAANLVTVLIKRNSLDSIHLQTDEFLFQFFESFPDEIFSHRSNNDLTDVD